MSNTTSSNPASLRIANLLDEGSFVEIGGQVTARATDFNMQEKKSSDRWRHHRLRCDRWKPGICIQPGRICIERNHR